MQSRMERYYQTGKNEDLPFNKRTLKNKELYNNIYEEVEYSNIEAVASLDKTNEIDINKIKQMLRAREEEQKEKPIIKRPYEIKEEYYEEKNYDINEILIKAKENKDDYSTSPGVRSLKNINFDKLNEDRKPSSNDYDEAELKELINTITSSSSLNKLKESGLTIDIFSELTDSNNDTITTDNESIRKIIAAQKEAMEKKEEKPTVVDTSFYTSGISFNKEDFESLEQDEEKSPSLLLKVFVFVSLVVVTAAIILGLIMLIK